MWRHLLPILTLFLLLLLERTKCISLKRFLILVQQQVQDLGYDGTGVKVAVLDSGIDYTHAAFGGEGTIEAYDRGIQGQYQSRRPLSH